MEGCWAEPPVSANLSLSPFPRWKAQRSCKQESKPVTASGCLDMHEHMCARVHVCIRITSDVCRDSTYVHCIPAPTTIPSMS